MRVIREVPEGEALLTIDKVMGQQLISLGVNDPTGKHEGVGVIILDARGAIAAYHALGEQIKELFPEERP